MTARIVGHFKHVPRLGRVVRVVARERDKGMARVRRVDGDPAHEPSRRRRRVDAVESHRAGRGVSGIRSHEDASAPQPGPERAIVARGALRCNDVAGGPWLLVSAEIRAGQPWHAECLPVPAGQVEGAEELVTVQFKEGLAAVVVLCPPDVLESRERRPVDPRVVDNRDVKRATFAGGWPWSEERVRDPVPTRLAGERRGGASKRHVDLCIEKGVQSLVLVERADA